MASGSLGMGFKVGHWTDRDGATGCTVVLPPQGNVASCDIRGSSPGSRELAALHPDRRLTEIHAVLLTGGSAYGLAAADGVMAWLEKRGVGYATPVALVPIVPAAVIFDLGSGRAGARPGPPEGRAACEAATEGPVATGRVGAGTGATVGKYGGFEHAAPGGLGMATARSGGLEVAALAVVNAVGDVVAPDGTVLAGASAPGDLRMRPEPPEKPSFNTVLVVVALRGNLDKRDVRWVAARGTDGITTAIRPAHTRYDGDVVIAIAAPSDRAQEPGDIDTLGELATEAVAGAVRAGVTP
ncbi:MAG: P1 family peptidase [Actinobacteria bacterium]|nr:P1 family peptidase [Actinomycetota bacterium]